MHESVETAAPEVQGVVHRSPQLYGINRSTWTLATLRRCIRWLNGECGTKQVSLSGTSRILKRLGACYKRGKAHIHSPDLDYHKKMAKITHAHLLNLLDPVRFPLLYEDEMSYYKFAEVAKAWGSRGTRGARKANQAAGRHLASRIAVGIDVQTGKLIARQRTTYPAKEMYRFFYYIEQQYKKAERIFIVLDNWPPHFSEYVKKNLARGAKKIVLLSLPTYAPWENPSEKVWQKLRKEHLAFHRFGLQWKDLKESVKQWLQQYEQGSKELLHFVGLNKKMEHYRSLFAILETQGRTEELLNMADLLPD